MQTNINNVIEELDRLDEAGASYVSPYLGLSDAERQQAKDEFISHFGKTGWAASPGPDDYCDVDAFHRGWDKELVEIGDELGINLLAIFGPNTKQVKASSEYGTIVKAAEKRGYPKVYNDPVLGHLANFWSAKWGTKRPTKDEWLANNKKNNINKNKQAAKQATESKLFTLVIKAFDLAVQSLNQTCKDLLAGIEKKLGTKAFEIKEADIYTLATNEDGTLDKTSYSEIGIVIWSNEPQKTITGVYKAIGSAKFWVRLKLEDDDKIIESLAKYFILHKLSQKELQEFSDNVDSYLTETKRREDYESVISSLTCDKFIKELRTNKNITIRLLITDYNTSVYLLKDLTKKIIDFADDNIIEDGAEYAKLKDATVLAIMISSKSDLDDVVCYSYNKKYLSDLGMDSPVDLTDKNYTEYSAYEAQVIRFDETDLPAFFTFGMDTWLRVWNK